MALLDGVRSGGTLSGTVAGRVAPTLTPEYDGRARTVRGYVAAAGAWVRRHWLINSFAAAVGGFNLLFPNRYYYHDAVRYASAVEGGAAERLFHHAHVLGSWYFYVIYRAVTALGLETRALYVAQAANTLGAVAVIGVTYAALTRVVRRPVAAFAAAFFASTFNFQFISTQGEVYILPLLIFAVVVLVLINNSFRLTWGKLAVVAALTALAVQLHCMYVLTAVSIAFAVGFRRDRRAVVQAAAFCIAVGVITAASYYAAAYAAGFRGWGAVTAWWGTYTHDSSFGYFSAATPIKVLKGWGKALVYSGFWKDVLGGYATRWTAAWSFLAAAALGGVIAVGVATARRVNRRVLRACPVRYPAFFGGTAALFAATAAWWDPGEAEPLTVPLLSLVFLGALVWDRAKPGRRLRALAVSVLLAMMAVNFVGYAARYTDLERNDVFAFTRHISRGTPPGASVVVSTEINWWLDSYLDYFFAEDLSRRRIDVRMVGEGAGVRPEEVRGSSGSYLYVSEGRDTVGRDGWLCKKRYRLRRELILEYVAPLNDTGKGLGNGR